MKKFLINLALILISFIIYFLQSNFFNWFTIAGIKPNLFVIYILFIGLFGSKSMGIIYGFIIGVILDYIYGEKIGSNMIGLAVTGLLAMIFNKNFSKDSRITIMLMVLGLTILFESITYFMNYLLYSINIEILVFTKILCIEIIYNIIITIIIYPLIQKFGYYIENEYNGNTVLTRYF